MGYARLNYTTANTPGQVMLDIVQVVTGVVTSAANLTTANTTNSEVVNTLAENWTRLFPVVAPTTTTAKYFLTSPCTTGTKTHYVQIADTKPGIPTLGSGGSANTAFSSAGTGIAMITMSAGTSGGVSSNETFYSQTAGATGIYKYSMHVDSTNTNIYVHWSQHHILIYGKFQVGAATGFMASIEYPETGLTQFTNTAPVLHYKNYYGLSTAFITETVPAASTNVGIVLQGVQVYVPATGVSNGVYNFGTSGSGTVDFATFDPVVSIGSDGNTAYPLVPIYWQSPAQGIPLMNLSQLTGFYRIAKDAGLPESVFTVGANSYVYLPISTTITGGTKQGGIALLKK